MRQTNKLIRQLLADMDREMPGYRARAERVSVYTVSIGQKLGMDLETLVSLRILAEVGGLSRLPNELLDLVPADDLSQKIVSISAKFDELRLNNDPEGAAENWLEAEAGKEYPSELVSALKSVQGIIQPIGS